MSTRSSIRAKSRGRGRQKRRAYKVKASPRVWEEVLRIARSIPESDLHKLPTDLSAHHDHYLYGSNGT